MPSPFPGMNPYLERAAVWPDFHNAYLTHLREALTNRVGPSYFVAIQERVYLHESDEDRILIGSPDVGVAREPKADASKRKGGAAVATAEAPAKVTIPSLRKRKVPYLEVADADGTAVVAVIELLSPSSKYAGDDRESYLTKRRELLGTGVNFVELDFLRGGPRMPLRGLASCDYYVMVSRPAARPEADVWPLRLRDPLPSIPVPLRPGEPEPLVDLQAVLHRTYDGAGYGRRIYRHDPEPRLAPADAEWAEQLIETATT